MKCEQCRGTKKITGIGHMLIKCTDCNGTGEKIVDADFTEELVPELNIVDIELQQKPRRGRPAMKRDV